MTLNKLKEKKKKLMMMYSDVSSSFQIPNTSRVANIHYSINIFSKLFLEIQTF